MLYASEANYNGDEKFHDWRGPIADLVVNHDINDVLAISFHDKHESLLVKLPHYVIVYQLKVMACQRYNQRRYSQLLKLMALFGIMYKMQEDIWDNLDEYLLDKSSSIFANFRPLKADHKGFAVQNWSQGNPFP